MACVCLVTKYHKKRTDEIELLTNTEANKLLNIVKTLCAFPLTADEILKWTNY